MRRGVFFCIDGHTAGNPVRLVAGGAPPLPVAGMSERRQAFLARHDWIRRSLMFEPRGHDMMSGGFLYPPFDPANDAAILFMETSGCLPMCGHGTIGIVTFAIEQGLVTPRVPGQLRLEAPAGTLEISYAREGSKVTWVRILNVASYSHALDLEVDVDGIGRLKVDIAYGGNFYAIIEPQAAYPGLDMWGAASIVEASRRVRAALRDITEPVHPLDPTIRGLSHVLWADRPRGAGASARNAVFYGERAIDRSPCGTGTSARMANLRARGRLGVGEDFVHESYIGSRFIGRVEADTTVAGLAAIRPSIQGAAVATGYNQIWVDDEDEFWEGFSVT